MQVVVFPQDAFEEDFLIGAIYGSICIQIAKQACSAAVIIFIETKITCAYTAAPIHCRKAKVTLIFHAYIIHRLEILKISESIFICGCLADLHKFIVIERDRCIRLRCAAFQICHPCEPFRGGGFEGDIIGSDHKQESLIEPAFIIQRFPLHAHKVVSRFKRLPVFICKFEKLAFERISFFAGSNSPFAHRFFFGVEI